MDRVRGDCDSRTNKRNRVDKVRCSSGSMCGNDRSDRIFRGEQKNRIDSRIDAQVIYKG